MKKNISISFLIMKILLLTSCYSTKINYSNQQVKKQVLLSNISINKIAKPYSSAGVAALIGGTVAYLIPFKDSATNTTKIGNLGGTFLASSISAMLTGALSTGNKVLYLNNGNRSKYYNKIAKMNPELKNGIITEFKIDNTINSYIKIIKNEDAKIWVIENEDDLDMYLKYLKKIVPINEVVERSKFVANEEALKVMIDNPAFVTYQKELIGRVLKNSLILRYFTSSCSASQC
jgi:2-hydroxy-3-keto-5-methylthiopentenyl-1-phosphate phosphatase